MFLISHTLPPNTPLLLGTWLCINRICLTIILWGVLITWFAFSSRTAPAQVEVNIQKSPLHKQYGSLIKHITFHARARGFYWSYWTLQTHVFAWFLRTSELSRLFSPFSRCFLHVPLHSWAGLSTIWRHLIVLPTMQLWEISLWERKTVTGRKVRPRGQEAGTERKNILERAEK